MSAKDRNISIILWNVRYSKSHVGMEEPKTSILPTIVYKRKIGETNLTEVIMFDCIP